MTVIQNKQLLLLFFIIILASVLRLYAISTVPVSLYWDEVAIGYNAYSLAETGKDEYGQAWPLLFKSFDDYKMPGYIYLTAFAIKLFGVSEFSVRISSAVMGIISVVLTYFLVQELFCLENMRNKVAFLLEKKKGTIALLAAFLLAISPWHLQFSRTGFEANGGLFFVLFAMYLFLVGRRNSIFFYVSLISFALGMYFYRSMYIFIPLLVVSLFVLFSAEFVREKKRHLITGVILFLLVLTPIVPQMLSEKGLIRVKQVSITNDIEQKLAESSQKIAENGNHVIDRIIYNRRIIIAETFISGYVTHFSPTFLFVSGDTNGRHHVVSMGLLYRWEIPFVILGLLVSLFLPWRVRSIILVWLALSPIAASLSSPTPHALRTLNMLPIPIILSAIGIVFFIQHITPRFQKVAQVSLGVIVIIFFVSYIHVYYFVTPPKTADDWADGYKQLVSYVQVRENKYDKIVITGAYWQPYIYFLFYNAYSPVKFQQEGTSMAFSKYYFGGTSWDRDKGRDGIEKEDLRKIFNKQKILLALSEDEYQIYKNELKNTMRVYNTFGKTRFIVGELQ